MSGELNGAFVTHTFGVDLRGVIDLLSHHLYSSPRVYLRELLQNAVDAITARRDLGPDFTAKVLIEPIEVTGNGTLRITDTGIGLTEDEVHSLLSTLGNTSKRDELGFARQGFLGQFGVGMLSCFLVAERIRLTTRSARGGPAVHWSADATGRYEVGPAPAGPDPEIGTVIELVPAPDAAHWLGAEMVRGLASDYGSLLPVPVTVAMPEGRASVNTEPPWLRQAGESSADHRERLAEYCQQTFGFRPFDLLPLAIPAAGLTGVAFVLPAGTHPGARQAHRVYLRRMLVGESVEGLLPDWAYFVRCVVDSSALRPTASRETLYQDETLLAIQDELGAQLRDWVVRLGATEPDRAAALLSAHRLGIKSVALIDDELLRLAERWLPFETADGLVTLRQFRRTHNTLLYTPDVDQFRQLAPVAQAQGLGLVNAGYAYDTELLTRLSEVDSELTVRRVQPQEVLASLGDPEPEAELALRQALAMAEPALLRHDCAVVLRDFDPVSLPALLITDQERERQRDVDQARQHSDPVWADLLGQLADTAAPADQLVLNCRNPLVRRIGSLTEPALVELAVESLYVHAVLRSHRPMRPKDTAALNKSLLDLLDRAVRAQDS